MSRKKIIAGNWKMNIKPSETAALVKGVAEATKDSAGKVDIVCCTPAIDVPAAVTAATGTQVEVGAENCHWKESGAYTGEISTGMLLDAGANMDCHPEWLVQFAIMGNAYSKAVLKRGTPSVGLISIGTEDCKGNEMTKQTFPLLKEVKDLNFVGNIEGKDLFKGHIDVAVCDGFVGNVVLKTTESIAKAIGYWLKKECFKGPLRFLGAILLKGAFHSLKEQLDPEIYGGAPLLGVPGTVIITHGSSSHKAIYYAVKAGVAAATNDVSGLIAKAIADHAEDQKQK